MAVNNCVVLASRPNGTPRPENFRVEQRPLEDLGANQYSVKIYLCHWTLAFETGWMKAVAILSCRPCRSVSQLWASH